MRRARGVISRAYRGTGGGAGSMAVPLTMRASAGIPGDDAGGSAAIAHERRAENVGTVRHEDMPHA